MTTKTSRTPAPEMAEETMFQTHSHGLKYWVVDQGFNSEGSRVLNLNYALSHFYKKLGQEGIEKLKMGFKVRFMIGAQQFEAEMVPGSRIGSF